LQNVAPKTRTARLHHPMMVAGQVVLVTAVLAPVALGAGVAALRFFDAGPTLAVALAATITCGLLSGFLAAPDLRRRIEQRPAPRLRAGHGSGER
jgi:hypothetical protein